MVVHLKEHDLLVLTLAKGGGTTLKAFLYEIDFGEPFIYTDENRVQGPYRYYPAKDFVDIPDEAKASRHRLAMVRDPVDRVLSCYRDKVVRGVYLGGLRRGQLAEAGLPELPDLEEFIARLHEYRKVSLNLWGHTKTAITCFGDQPDWLTEIFDMSELQRIAHRIEEITGRTATLDHHNKTAEAGEKTTISRSAYDLLMEFYDEEYSLYGPWMIAEKGYVVE